MKDVIPADRISPLRKRLIDEMNISPVSYHQISASIEGSTAGPVVRCAPRGFRVTGLQGSAAEKALRPADIRHSFALPQCYNCNGSSFFNGG